MLGLDLGLDAPSRLDARFFGLGSMLDARFLMVLEMPAVTLVELMVSDADINLDTETRRGIC